jgi:hypothetical protein
VSFIDAVLLMAASPRPIRFIMDHRIFAVPVLGWLFKLVKSIPIAPQKEDPVFYVRAFEQARAVLAEVRQDAALMLHDEHRDADEVAAYLQRWLLINDSRARQMLRFLSSPLWRAYTSTYIEGYRLLRAWLDDRPAGVGLTERFTRLLDEPLIPSSLRAELPI